MLGVVYPIDVICLNNKRKVVALKERFMPLRFYFPKEKAQYVLELKAGIIQAYRIKRGDILTVENEDRK